MSESFRGYIDRTLLWFKRGHTHPIKIHLPLHLHNKLLKELAESYNIYFEADKLKPFTYAGVCFMLSSSQGMTIEVSDLSYQAKIRGAVRGAE